MPPTLAPLRRRPSLAPTRTKNSSLSRSLEDLHASLLRAGARKAGITTLSVKPFSGDDSGATPPATTSPLEISPSPANKQPFSLPRTTSNDHRPPPLTTICLHAFVELEEEHVYPPSPARASPAVPTAKCVSEWVWGVHDKKGLREVDAGKKKGGTRCLDRDTACEASKMLFLDKDDPASSTFDSVCSTVAPTERTLSISEDRPSSLVLDTATAIPAKEIENKRRGRSKLQVEGDALDAPFMHRLCDMSVRFPQPPAKDVPPTSSKARALATRGFSVKSLMFTLPALPLILGHKTVLGSKRRRKSVALWKARSEGTTSMEVSFQQKLSRAKDAFGSKDHLDARECLVISKASLANEPVLCVPPPPQAMAPRVPHSISRTARGQATICGQHEVNPPLRLMSSNTLVNSVRAPPVAKESWVWSEYSAPRKEGTRRKAAVLGSGIPRDPRRGGGGRVGQWEGAGRARSRRVLVVTPIVANALKRRDFLVH